MHGLFHNCHILWKNPPQLACSLKLSKEFLFEEQHLFKRDLLIYNIGTLICNFQCLLSSSYPILKQPHVEDVAIILILQVRKLKSAWFDGSPELHKINVSVQAVSLLCLPSNGSSSNPYHKPLSLFCVKIYVGRKRKTVQFLSNLRKGRNKLHKILGQKLRQTNRMQKKSQLEPLEWWVPQEKSGRIVPG